jgi:glycosyltransferase 2 family protein
MSDRRKLVLRYVFAIGALLVLFRLVDPSVVVDSIAGASPAWVAVAFALAFALIGLNTVKWRVLVASQLSSPPSLMRLARLNLASALYGTLLPGQLAGEAVKVVRLARDSRDRVTLVGSVLADRVTGFLGLLLIGLVGALVAGAPLAVTITLAVSLLFALGVSVAISFVPARMAGPERAGGIVRRLVRGARATLAATAGYRQSPGTLVVALVLSVMFQAGVTMVIGLLARSLDMHVGWSDLAWVTAIVSVVQLLPITVASVGTREGAFMVLLVSLEQTRPDALALSLLVLASNLALALVGAIAELLPDPAANEQIGAASHAP